MTRYQFTKNRIYAHTERLGFDVRPIIEVKMERQKLSSFGEYLVDNFPDLFESLVTSANEFHIRKRLVFPGKAEADVQTFVLTRRGPVFVFPRVLAQLEEETDLRCADDVIRDCLRKFLEVFPDRQIRRAGKVHEYAFGTDDIPGKQIITERFLKLPESSFQEVLLKLNLADDEYNRSVELSPVQMVRRRAKDTKRIEEHLHGVSVNVDFNNKDMSQSLSVDRICSILRRADEFAREELYDFLNEGEVT